MTWPLNRKVLFPLPWLLSGSLQPGHGDRGPPQSSREDGVREAPGGSEQAEAAAGVVGPVPTGVCSLPK